MFLKEKFQSNPKMQIQKIILNEKIAEGTFLLSFKRDFDFIPGQVIKITTNTQIPPRLYSIASGNAENVIRILYKEVIDGQLTPELCNLTSGDKIYVSSSFGKFICTEQHAYWIASGTGIAPFASMFYSGQATNKTIIHGEKTLNHFYFQNDFKKLAGNYIRCCTRETDPSVFSGRVTEYLQSHTILASEQKYYLCGSAEMIVETRDLLISKGISFQNIIAEIYF